MNKVLAVIGTRPEAIKMAPVILEMRARQAEFEVLVCSTGQHLELLDQALSAFGLAPDINLRVMTANQSLSEVAGRLFPALDDVLIRCQPDWVLLQGDTLSVMVGALASHFRRVKIGHVEAGLRSHNKWHPFPEETNRRVTSVVADLNFVPTEMARQHLLDEGTPANRIVRTGNTVVDALLYVDACNQQVPPSLPDSLECLLASGKEIVLVTGHRRENFGVPFENICRAIRRLADRYPHLAFVYPVHPNPNVQDVVHRFLIGHDRIHLVAPLAYAPFVRLMSQSRIVLTDSGGIQEEAPSFGKPVLIMRKVTERPEGVEAGTSKLVGTDTEDIVRAVEAEMANELFSPLGNVKIVNPFGDGLAAKRIADAIVDYRTEND